MKILTQEYLKSILNYDKETGDFTWIYSRKYTLIGRNAGGYDKYGYKRIWIDGKFFFSHRLAWLFVTGNFPENQIDHVNQIKDDNKFSNLRDVTHDLNQKHKTAPNINNSVGIRGVYRKGDAYKAEIKCNGIKVKLGTFKTAIEAKEAYMSMKLKLIS